jgi:hypothetical protein
VEDELFNHRELVQDAARRGGLDVAVHARHVLVRALFPRVVEGAHLVAGCTGEGLVGQLHGTAEGDHTDDGPHNCHEGLVGQQFVPEYAHACFLDVAAA